jgi:hypothetical protein
VAEKKSEKKACALFPTEVVGILIHRSSVDIRTETEEYDYEKYSGNNLFGIVLRGHHLGGI